MKSILMMLGLFFLMCAPCSTILGQQGPMNYPEQSRLANQAQYMWWNSLSSRQKYLVKAVDTVVKNYRQQTGSPYVPLTRDALIAVMQSVRAYESEANFVWQRLQFNARYYSTEAAVDRQLNYMQQNPQWYLPEHMRNR